MIQRVLSNRFSKFSKDGKQLWYKNKRTERDRSNTLSINFEEFAKTIYAFRHGSADMYGGTSFLFDTGPDKGYIQIFGLDGHLVEDVTERQFERLAGTWFFCDSIRAEHATLRKQRVTDEEKLIAEIEASGESPPPPATRNALERRWMVYYAVGESLRSRYADPEELDDDLRKWSDPSLTTKNPQLSDAVAQYCGAACESLIRVYRADSSMADFAHRNWFRSTGSLVKIRTDSLDHASAVAALPSIGPG